MSSHEKVSYVNSIKKKRTYQRLMTKLILQEYLLVEERKKIYILETYCFVQLDCYKFLWFTAN